MLIKMSRKIKYYLAATILVTCICNLMVQKSARTEAYTNLAEKNIAKVTGVEYRSRNKLLIGSKLHVQITVDLFISLAGVDTVHETSPSWQVGVDKQQICEKTGRVYGNDKNCTEYISTDKISNIKRLLNMKTTKDVEDILYGLGYPKRTTSSGDVYLPDLPDPKVHIPDIPVIVAGASSNHYREMQAMMHNIDTVIRPVYPHIKVILYDIGFTERERQAIIKYERCELRKFNFTKYPDHIKYLQTCAWKPIIIQEVLNQHGFTMYMDASIRLKSGNLTRAFNQVKRSGINYIYAPFYNGFIPNHTFSKTFEYFDTKPCLFYGLHELQAGFNIVVKNTLYAYTIMRSWLTCCLQRYCVMPKGAERRTSCSGFKGYHKCHRNDQSALSIAVYMTNDNSVGSLGIPNGLFSIRRGHQMKYFH